MVMAMVSYGPHRGSTKVIDLDHQTTDKGRKLALVLSVVSEGK
jgi:hypothetical protein